MRPAWMALCAGVFAAVAAGPAIAQTRPAPRPEAAVASDAPAAISRADDPPPLLLPDAPDAPDAAWPAGASDAAVPPPARPESLSRPAAPPEDAADTGAASVPLAAPGLAETAPDEPAAAATAPPEDAADTGAASVPLAAPGLAETAPDEPAADATAPPEDAADTGAASVPLAAPGLAETAPDEPAAAATAPPEDAADTGAASVPLAEQRPQPRPETAPAAADTPAPTDPVAADPPAPAIRTLGPATAPVAGKTPTAGGAAPGLIEPEPVRPDGGAGTLSLRALCGNPRIIGRGEEPIRVNARGCGISAPVRVWEVDGVRLDPPALIDCPTAGALFEWVDRDLRPVFRDTGGGLAGISVASAYACPAQFGPPAGRGHLHAVGKALDLSAVALDDGTRISVFAGWDSPAWGALLNEAAERACGIFEVVLTPKAAAGERSSIHLDTGRMVNGPYCR